MKVTPAILAVILVLAGCGGSAESEPAPPACEGVVVRGACWTASGGISLTADRVARVLARAEEYWDHPRGSLVGWRLEFGPEQVVVDGTNYDGYCWADEREIHVAPFVSDCFERSAIFHELGHAWGFHENDPRMTNEWPLIQAAMAESGWAGCRLGDDGDDDGPVGRAAVGRAAISRAAACQSSGCTSGTGSRRRAFPMASMV